jgi:hypothetical protein
MNYIGGEVVNTQGEAISMDHLLAFAFVARSFFALNFMHCMTMTEWHTGTTLLFRNQGYHSKQFDFQKLFLGSSPFLAASNVRYCKQWTQRFCKSTRFCIRNSSSLTVLIFFVFFYEEIMTWWNTCIGNHN